MSSQSCKASWLFVTVVFCLLIIHPVSAQEHRSESEKSGSGSSATASPHKVLASPDEDYRIGAGDVIEIKIEDAPELSVSRRVAANGTFLMNFLGRVTAQGRTPEELEKIIADGLRGRYLKNPQVSVVVTQYNSRSFFIQGAVRSPGVYQMEGKPTLLKLITIAGGLQETHGSTAFIIREMKDKKPDTAPVAESGTTAASAEVVEGANYEMIQASIGGLLKGNFAQNVVIEPGDIINIPQRDVFFVAGEVHAPGSFLLKDGTTLRQAIALAQGTTIKAAQSRASIFREESNTGRRVEIKIDVGAVMSGKLDDIAIAPNDVIIVPNSRGKSVGATLLSAFGTNVVTRGVMLR
ncbi:MAG: polysaccharide biosynthesis/export family protein [Blastocatellia bacterium]